MSHGKPAEEDKEGVPCCFIGEEYLRLSGDGVELTNNNTVKSLCCCLCERLKRRWDGDGAPWRAGMSKPSILPPFRRCALAIGSGARIDSR